MTSPDGWRERFLRLYDEHEDLVGFLVVVVLISLVGKLMTWW